MKASEYIKQYTDPIYQWFFDYGLFIVIIIAAFLIIRLSVKVMKMSDARRWRRAEYGNTNTWFSIDEDSENEVLNQTEPQKNKYKGKEKAYTELSREGVV